jgi:hypothetical protein
VFTCFVHTSLALHVLFSVGDRDERAFNWLRNYVPDGGM